MNSFSAEPQVFIKISKHVNLPKPLGLNLDVHVHRFQKGKGLSQSLPTWLWKVFYSWRKSCCAPWATQVTQATMSRYHRTTEWIVLKRTSKIIQCQSLCCRQGCLSCGLLSGPQLWWCDAKLRFSDGLSNGGWSTSRFCTEENPSCGHDQVLNDSTLVLGLPCLLGPSQGLHGAVEENLGRVCLWDSVKSIQILLTHHYHWQLVSLHSQTNGWLQIYSASFHHFCRSLVLS